MPQPSPDPVVIVGGGFSGAMLAARLAERGVASTIVSRAPEIGLGVAYSTPFDGHLLNVRAGRMSAVADRPDDFVRWLRAAAPERADPNGFAPRRLYGLYLQDRFGAVRRAHPGLIRCVVGEAAALEAGGVALADGPLIRGRAVVLATGNPPPRTASGGGRVIADPWAPEALERVGPHDQMVILGTGLTMVDVLLWLEAEGWKGRATALSRRGLTPRVHGPEPDPAVEPTAAILNGPASARLAAGRRLAEEAGWRSAMEALRPITADVWRAMPVDVRGRLVRHLRPWWDVHRHRLAPEIGRRLEALTRAGRLTVVAGRVRSVEESPDAASLVYAPRGGGAPRTIQGAWLIDCTGPGHDPARDPLTGPLLAAGRACLDPLRLGLELDEAGRVVDGGGRPDPRLFVLGPPARGAYWETVAVPDIRNRIEAIAVALLETAR